jgi:hypothetical protein
MLASSPASMLNQNSPDLGIPNRIELKTSRSSLGKQSIKTNEYQPIKNTKGLPSRRGSTQNVDLLPKHPDLCLPCCSRSHQVDERPENQPAKISHYAVASADSPLLANWIKFTIGTGALVEPVISAVGEGVRAGKAKVPSAEADPRGSAAGFVRRPHNGAST